MKNKSIAIIFILFIFAIVIAIAGAALLSFNDHEYTITITDKERIVSDDESYYLVFGEDEKGELLVFKNSDNLFRSKFNSSNLQGELKEGETYIITVIGYRIPFLSNYENIIKNEEVAEASK